MTAGSISRWISLVSGQNVVVFQLRDHLAVSLLRKNIAIHKGVIRRTTAMNSYVTNNLHDCWATPFPIIVVTTGTLYFQQILLFLDRLLHDELHHQKYHRLISAI